MANSADLLTEMKLKIEEYVRELVKEVGAEPNLGLASTGEILAELAARMGTHPHSIARADLGLACQKALLNLTNYDLNYTTFYGEYSDTAGG